MNLFIGTLILAWLILGCALMVSDVWNECRHQTTLAEHEELLDELWGED